MEELTKAEKRNQARLYIAKIDDYHLEEQALVSQLELLQKRLGPSGLPHSSLSERTGGGGAMGIMDQFKELTRLKDEITTLKEKAVEAECNILRCIYNIPEPKYRAILIEKYVNRRDMYAISLVYRQLGMQNNSTNYIKRTIRKAEEAFYDYNLKN